MKSNSFLFWGLDSPNNPVLEVSVFPQNTFRSTEQSGASWRKNVRDNLKKATVSTFIQTKCASKNISCFFFYTTSLFGALLQYVCNGVFECAFVYPHDSTSSRTTQHFFPSNSTAQNVVYLHICRAVYEVLHCLLLVAHCPSLSMLVS